MEILSTSFGEFQLSRFPKRTKELLRAWDAADEYLLQHIANEQLINENSRVLIINDQYGALSISLNPYKPKSVSDSWISHKGIKENLLDNSISSDMITLHSSLDYPDETFDLVIIKIPKSLAMLEDQLIRIRPLLHEKSVVIAGAMVKAIHNSTLKLFEKLLGATTTSLAKKKARLIFPSVDLSIQPKGSPYPSNYILENTQHEITNHAAVFSRENLDIGTRFFLEHLPVSNGYKQIIDLGCGNGIVGLIAAEKNPDAELSFVDESFMAVESAKLNFTNAFGQDRKAHFLTTDCLKGLSKNSYDLILNNPPFHQQNVVGDFIAKQMFREAHSALEKGGELWVIGNRHLGYHVTLKKIFGNCTSVANNKKFVILKAIKAV